MFKFCTNYTVLQGQATSKIVGLQIITGYFQGDDLLKSGP